MGNIVLLDDLTINKIAAGEVIERPASVVKEMVENSIDAGAKNITVEIKNGGISLIKITDDGCGIAEDDMEIAFERHATSKIRTAEDLTTVKSMGFRGEALASVAAISKIEMISKKADEQFAHKIVVEGGKTIEFTEAARSVGTTITVQNLFYNTPVRYKFLKKDYTEAGYIEDAVTRIALVNKDISIKLISNGKTIVQTNGNGDLKTVIYSVYGKDIAAEINEIEYEYEGIKVTGVVGKPVIARANRSNQLFFLNGRYIKDKNLTAAGDQAYKGMIPVGRYGFLVLNLEMDPSLVDVNVHPAKLEVRFEEESKVFKAVYHAIKSSLAQSELVENIERETLEEKKSDESENTSTTINISESSETYNKENSEILQENNEDRNEEKKKGIAGLFSKIIKEPEETEEELSNNHLEEIFKYRQALKEKTNIEKITNLDNINIDENSRKAQEYISKYKANKSNEDNAESVMSDINIQVNENIEESNIINDDEVSKKVTLGNTIISSETKELNINNSSSVIKDSTTVMNSTKLAQKEPTQSVNINDENKVLEENKEENGYKQEVDQVEKNTSGEDFSKIAQKLIESKINFDNTQTIDTAKVREAIKEEYESNPEFDEMYKKTFGVDPFSVRKEKEQEKKDKEKINVSNEFEYAGNEENMTVFEDKAEFPEIPYKFIGIVFNTYIVIEIKDEMYIIDQHAAHERILYEKVKNNYYNDGEKDEQMLLLPDVISLTHKEMSIAKENIDMFARAGFSFEEFGDNTIKLMSVPSMCEDMNTKQLFLDILDEIDTVAVTARQEKEDKFIATVACKAAVKGKMKLDEKEVKALMKKLLDLPNPFTCPHGRPTAIKMTNYDLERKFRRS